MSASEAKTPSGKRTFRIVAIIAVVLAALATVAVVVALIGTSNAQFFSRYHLLNRRYVNLESSAHEGIGCRACHEREPISNGVSLVADYYSSFFKRGATPTYFKFAPPENAACLKCHLDDWSFEATQTALVPHPAHTRVASESRPCVSCHKWTAHLETYIPDHKKMPLSDVCVAYGCHVGTKVTTQCYQCHHVLRYSATQWRAQHPTVVKVAGENACLEGCHKVEQCQECHTTGKTPTFTKMPTEVGLAIETLHVKPEWVTQYHGPVALQDKTQCLKCHQNYGECNECHRNRPAFHGATAVSWIGRHQKVAKSVSDPRCLECHNEQTWCVACHKQFKEMQ